MTAQPSPSVDLDSRAVEPIRDLVNQIRDDATGMAIFPKVPSRLGSARTDCPAQACAPTASPGVSQRLKRVLVVEDNMIIALDTEENLRALGIATVDVAGSNDAALAIIDSTPPDFAFLDFNLGGETSEPIARALDQRGVAFAFASGYGEVEAMAGNYARRVATLQKPYSKDDLARILRVPAET